MVRLFFLLMLFLFASSIFAQSFRLSGVVSDAINGEKLPGVNLLVQETSRGAVSDLNGVFVLELPEGNYNLRLSFIGYKTFEKSIHLKNDKTIDIALHPMDTRLGEVVVSAQRSNRNVDRAELGTLSLDIETIRNLPAFLGEVDVIRNIQLLPGVQSAGDGNTGFFVRGGNSDQNLVLFDDAVVYNASHLFNFFSVFNPDAVKDVTLYKGGIPSSYGGRLSSVLDVSMREGSMDYYRFNGGVGLISSRLSFEGPLQEGRSAFILAGRRTYADLFLKLSPDEAQRDTRLFFYDLNAKMNYVFNDRNRIFASAYYGRDITSLGELFGFDWGNATGSLRWNHIFNPDFFVNTSMVYSNYVFNITGDIGPAEFLWQSTLESVSVKSDFTSIFYDNHILNFGVQSTYHNVNPGIIRASIEGAAETEVELSANNALEFGLFSELERDFFDNRLLVNFGMRYSVFQRVGPGTQYSFDQSNPLLWEVSDTLIMERAQLYNRFQGWEPRLNLRLLLTENQSLKASYNRMFQYIQQAQSAQSVAPYDIWYMAGNNIPPQRADQLSLGYFHNFLEDLWEVSVEVYYKDMQNVSDVVDNGDILGNELVEGELRIGRGWSYGAELLLQKQNGRITGFAGYTWAISKREIPEINMGMPYFAPNDRRHDLSLAGAFQFNERWNMGLNFIYATGTAFNLPVGKLVFQNTVAPIFSERNASRLPDYHRMDVSVTYTPRGRAGSRVASSWNFSVFNVYGRVNPISVSFAEKEERPGVPNTSFFYIPGPIPAITWNFNF